MSDADQLLSTGIEGLDAILGGGLPGRRMYLVEGDPGVGKTTLALQFLLEGVRRGEATLYVTLSETAEELRAIASSHGWSLDGVTLYEMSTGDPADSLGDEENTLYFPAEVELGERMRALLAEVDRVMPRRIVVDSSTELRLLAQTPLRFRRQILALKQQFVRRDCTILLLENPVERRGDVLLQSLVHGVLHLELLSPQYGAERRRMMISKLRQVKFRGGYHDFNVVRGGLVVFPRLVAAEHHAEYPRETLASGVPGLDALLGGGLDRGTGTLLTGPAGSGKSAISTRFVWAAAERGEKVAVFIFDEGIGTFFDRAASLGMDLRAHADSGHVAVQQVDPAELSPGEFVHAVRQAVEVAGATLVVIDSLNGFLHAMPEEQFLVLQLHELMSYLRQRGVVTILVLAQAGLVGAMASPVDVSYLADTVVLLRYFESLGRVGKAVSVLKKRSGMHEDTIREFSLGPDGVQVGGPLDKFQGVLTGVPRLEARGG
jgi:circadian clock protein KaiC